MEICIRWTSVRGPGAQFTKKSEENPSFPKFIISYKVKIFIDCYVQLLKQSYNLLSSSYIYADNSVNKC